MIFRAYVISLSAMMNKVDIFGETFVRKNGAFVVPNRLDINELIVIERMLGAGRIKYILEENTRLSPEMEKHFSTPGLDGATISLKDPHPDFVGKTLAESIEKGQVLIFVPGRVETYRGALSHVPSAVLHYISRFGLKMTPLFIGHYGDMGQVSKNEHLHQTILHFGEQIEQVGEIAQAYVLESWLSLSATAMSSQPVMSGSLGAMVVRGMKAHPHARFIDGIDDSSLPNHLLLGVAIAFAKHLQKLTSRRRVGIILPPGKGALLANLACLLAGKIPVNINFTASAEAISSSIKQSEVDRFITADTFVRKLPDFPWPPLRDLILLERERMVFQKKAKWWVLATRMMPASMIIKMLDLESACDDDEAVLLFTSGSSGSPKGVPLTHRNIIGNIVEARSRIDLSPDSRLLGCLPIFHSFGCTITLWFPLVCGYDVVTYPSPKEAKRLGELIRQYSVELMVTTPTFARSFIKRVPVEDMRSIKYCIMGAEKLSPDLAESFKNTFGFYPIEGYGMTETSPVCSVNMPSPPAGDGLAVLPSERIGTVGQLLPGMAVKVTDPTTEEPYPLTKTGMLWFKGANVFSGYLGMERLNREIIKDGWFRSGDVGRVDADGFLHIEGRISRFSKIGGEMVPHEQLEISILRAMGLDPTDMERHVAVVGIPDKQKGEAIVLLTTVIGPSLHQDLMVLRYKLLDLGIPALWCPRFILPVRSIPILNSGKLDINQCIAMVKDAKKSGLI